MNEINRNIWSPYKKVDNKRKSIERLDSDSINRIAAGEVIERPAAAVKELIENSLDANSTAIKIFFSNGGKSFLKVVDDGWGIPIDELKLAVCSHATSKIVGKDLLNINTFGFRGEALPSIGAVASLKIRSREYNSSEAGELHVNGGKIGQVRPVALEKGTVVELTDLFYATPARLKFLRSDQAETRAIIDVFKRLAIGNPDIELSLSEITKSGERKIFDLLVEPAPICLVSRISQILGSEFSDNSVDIKKQQQGYSIIGYSSLPTNSRGSAIHQYFYVNGRPVKDKQLTGALRAAYYDFMNKDRFPACVLFINCESSLVDINVHPMKSEIRFKNPSDVRGLVINGIKEALASTGLKSNTVLSRKILSSFSNSYRSSKQHFSRNPESLKAQLEFYKGDNSWTSGRVEPNAEESLNQKVECQLGVARAQIHENYIVAQTANGLVLVDQHAAHERIVYERLKYMRSKGEITSQALLIPEIVEVSVEVETAVLSFIENFRQLGFDVESFGKGSICVRGIPSILGNADPKLLINDVLDELLDKGSVEVLNQKIDSIISRISCHGSIRSGKKLTGEEMNQLLREMEKVPYTAQCNHGRPTFVELKLEDVEKLFGRR